MSAHMLDASIQIAGCNAIFEMAPGTDPGNGQHGLWILSARVAVSKSRRQFLENAVLRQWADKALTILNAMGS